MNSFQKQFNSLLGMAVGAKKIFGTPSAPEAAKPQMSTATPSAQPTGKESKKGGDYEVYTGEGFSDVYTQSAAATADVPEAKRYLAKQRSLQNLINRREALAAIKREKEIRKIGVAPSPSKSNYPVGSIISNRGLGGMY